MAAGTCACLCSTLLFAVIFVSVSADHKIITVQSGRNAILPCQAPNDKGSIRVVRWTKPDLQKKIVHLYVDGRLNLEDQNPSFKNRVDLQERQMKDGDVSLILKDVTINDAGTYECSVTQKKDLPYTTTITLDLRVINSKGSFAVNVAQTSYQAEENHNITMEWTFTVETGRSPTYLNIYCELIKPQSISALYHVRNGAEVSEFQDEKFSGRVQGDKDALREGRIRVQLCRLRTEDSGRYRCEVNTDYGLSSASCRLKVTAADLLPLQRPTLPPQEERKNWKIIITGLTAAAAVLALLIMCTLLWVMFIYKKLVCFQHLTPGLSTTHIL